VCICRLLPMTFFSTKYKVLSKHFWNTLIVWFILLTENWDKQMLKWMLCIVVAFVKDVYSISWSQFEIWIIILFTMLIVMFFWSLSCNFDKSKVCWIWQFIKFEFLHKTSFVNVVCKWCRRLPTLSWGKFFGGFTV
jgi:hypothetical protein